MMRSMESLSRTGPVLVIGASGLDVIAHLSGSFQAGSSNPAKVRTSYGGVARNVAENLARLGQDVILITAMGEDQNGTQVLAHTEDSGVDISQVIRTDVYPTGFYMGVLDQRGARQFAFDDMRIMDELNVAYLTYHEDLFEKAGCRIKEVVVQWSNRDQSDTKSQTGELRRYLNESLEMAREVMRIELNRLQGLYD